MLEPQLSQLIPLIVTLLQEERFIVPIPLQLTVEVSCANIETFSRFSKLIFVLSVTFDLFILINVLLVRQRSALSNECKELFPITQHGLITC